MSNDTSSKNYKPPGRIAAFMDRLSTSNLVFVVAAAFVIDLFVPDVLPFVDEMVLGMATILLTRWRAGAFRRAAEAADGSSGNSEGDGSKPPPKNVTPNS